jgi:hypothetical protein
MDCPTSFRLCAGKEAQMEQETIQLVRRLCSEAGIIMEDTSAVALITPTNSAELRAVVDQLAKAIVRMGAIIAGAQAMLRKP